jgi:ligand-binding sensor domain-containing protein/two-component sensor histidine kinase
MKYALLLTIALTIVSPYSSFSQEYSYTHYDIAEGLAGSTVYCIAQDKDGFIWVGTETGLSRFDGTHFKNFTTNDGLPDIEILQMFGDSKGRVWMAPFRKSVCYYYKGKIHNQDNDSLLRGIRLRENIQNFAEDARGNILLQETTALHVVGADGSVKNYDSIGKEPIRNCVAISRSSSGHFNILEGGKVFEFSDKGFSFLFPITFPGSHPNFIAMSPGWIVWRENSNRASIRSLVTRKTGHLPFGFLFFHHISYSLIADSLLYWNESNGVGEYNLNRDSSRRFLPGKEVSRTFRDQSGNLWFATLGQGIYRLNSDEFRSLSLQTNKQGISSISSIHAIRRMDNELWVGDNHNLIFQLSLPGLAVKAKGPLALYQKNRILYISRIGKDKFMYGSDFGMVKCTNSLNVLGSEWGGVKSVFEMSDDRLLLSGSWGVGIFDVPAFRIKDTLWKERATTAYYHHDTIYIGTLNGLYRMTKDRTVTFLGKNIPFLRKRVSAITEYPDGTLWIGSYDDAGIIAYKDDRITASITKNSGLTSGICRNLLIHNNILWVGTDKGLNKIQLDKPGYPITRFTSDDGLGADIVNTVYADSSTIYVGTSAGLSYFDESRTNTGEECRLYLLAAINAGINKIEDTIRLLLPYKESDIRFEFAAISYRSVGGITYKYRMNGLDSIWKETNQTYLEYPTLPSGNYIFQLQAVNKFGIKSRTVSFAVIVDTPFWKTIWFLGMVLLVSLGLVWLTISLRIRTIHRRQKEKDQLNQKMFQLEHRALQAQMNPHFIFNCLNSIQQNIFGQDIFTANKYISGLAKLIRATLQNSTLPFISLAEEVEFLSTYLSLEKLRFKDKMEYSVIVDPGIDKHSLLIPPMILQPYVENSMRHGLRHKTEGKGYIRIEISQDGERLKISIEDNGIGREKAARYKTTEHIEYQSKGMSLTADRIRIMNTAYGKDINVEVTDLEDGKGLAAGTRVIIQFLLFDNDFEK